VTSWLTDTKCAASRHTTMSRRAAVWLVVVAFALTMSGTTLPTPLYVLYQQRLGFSTLVSTVVFAAYAGGVIVALLLFGRVSDLIGRRSTLLPALGCSIASGLAFIVAHDLSLLLVGRVLSGISAGIFSGTATATLVDLAGDEGPDRAIARGTVANMAGLGLGPLFSGLVAQVAPAPLLLPYLVHVGLLMLAAIGMWFLPETVAVSVRPALPRPRLQVPRPTSAAFFTAVTAAFPGFAMVGLYTSVAPAVMRRLLERPDPALAGVVVFTVFMASTLGQVFLVPCLGRRALPVGCCVLVVGLGVLAFALAAGSLALLIIAGGLGGLGQGVTLRAGLSLIHANTPAANRAEVSSAFFVAMYVAISVPIVGVGLAIAPLGLTTAGTTFCAAMSLIALVALVALVAGGMQQRPELRPACPASTTDSLPCG
jgi:MFS family permease